MDSHFSSWTQFKQRTIFLSCSADMAAEALIVQQVVQEVNRLLHDGDQWNFYHWKNVDETWSATGTWQENIPRSSDPQVGLVICLLGERLGLPLPDYFPLPFDEMTLPDWVRFPSKSGGAEGKLALTGTLFEILDATQAAERRPPDPFTGVRRPEVLAYIKVDASLFTRSHLRAEERSYGFEHHYNALRGNQARIRDRRVQADYDNQIDQLDMFCERFFRQGGHPYTCFGSPEATHDECLAAFRKRLSNDLRRVLKVPEQVSQRRELKGLLAYQPEDHDVLFGRDKVILRILERLRALSASGRAILAIVGRSGEGKSSLLRAGLIGRLSHGRYPDFGLFHPVIADSLSLRLQDPIASLIEMIEKALGRSVWWPGQSLASFSAAERVAQAAAAVRNTIAALPPDPAKRPRRLFIGIDQFEELLGTAEAYDWARNGLLELLAVLQALAEAGTASIVVTLPALDRDRLTRLARNWPIETEVLGPPGRDELRDIVQGSLEAAGESAPRAKIEAQLEEVDAWLGRQEDPGPVLPLVSSLLVERQLAEREARQSELRARLRMEDPVPKPPATLDTVLDILGARAWDSVDTNLPNPDEALGYLLRQLVLTGIKEGGALKLLRYCPIDHHAVRQAWPLVEALKKHRLLIQPRPDVLRLVHVSIIDNWWRARNWYETERQHQLFLAELEPKAKRWRDALAQGSTAPLLTDPRDLDAVEELWCVWRDDQDRLPVDFMRASLSAYFDPGSRPESWRRSDGISRLGKALFFRDRVLVECYIDRVSTLPESQRLDIVRAVNPVSGNTALHVVAATPDLAAAKRLLSFGAHVNVAGYGGYTPLAWAARSGNTDMASMLLDADADPDIATDDGQTPLMIALARGDEAMAELLIERDKNIDQPGRDWTKVMPLAAASGMEKTIIGLLDRGAAFELSGPAYTKTLREAASNNHEAVVRVLLDRGTLPSPAELSELLWVAARSEPIVRFLLDLGAEDKADPEESHYTALALAASFGEKQVVQLLLERGYSPDGNPDSDYFPLSVAAEKGHEEILRLLIGHGAQLDRLDEGGRSPLTYAVQNGHIAAARLLLDAGASVNLPICSESTRAHGTSAVAIASGVGNIEMLDLLLSYGADPNLAAQEGWTALLLAARNGHYRICERLLQAGARQDLAHSSGRDAVSFAAERNDSRILNLLKANRPLDVPDAKGRTPLHWASAFGCAAALRVLVEHAAAALSSPDDAGRTPLDVALAAGHEDCAEIITSAGGKSSSSSPASAASLKDFTMEFLEPLGGMRINVLVNQRGRLCMVHNNPFRSKPHWVRYNSVQRSIEVLFSDNTAADIPVPVDDEIHAAFLGERKILMIRMRNLTPVEGFDTDIILEDVSNS